MPLLDNEFNRAGAQSSKERLASWETLRSGDREPANPDRRATGISHSASQRGSRGVFSGLVSTCSNPACESGWLQLWRSRSGPFFEGGWGCSARCISANIEAAVRRETKGKRIDSTPHRHRLPLGLVMLEQGWITSDQLRKALDAQRAAGRGRLGNWLVHEQGVSEPLVTRALGLQWSCPVLPLEHHDPGTMASVLPRLFIEAFGALPLRVAAGQILYLGFEERPDPVVTLAAERMLGLRVEAGLVHGSQFRPAFEKMMSASYPKTELVEAASESPLVRVLTKAVDRFKPAESKLVRMHDCLWLRMWKNPRPTATPDIADVEDVICSLAAN
jgi:hypothetical protein